MRQWREDSGLSAKGRSYLGRKATRSDSLRVKKHNPCWREDDSRASGRTSGKQSRKKSYYRQNIHGRYLVLGTRHTSVDHESLFVFLLKDWTNHETSFTSHEKGWKSIMRTQRCGSTLKPPFGAHRSVFPPGTNLNLPHVMAATILT